MPETRTICTPDDARALSNWLVGLPMPFTLTVKEGKVRSLSQNALLHKLFGEIAEHFGDRTASDVKGECHLAYGLPIRLRDTTFAWVWERSGAGIPVEKQRTLLASGALGVSSGMSTKELKEYIDEIYLAYTQAGCRLTVPEGSK